MITVVMPLERGKTTKKICAHSDHGLTLFELNSLLSIGNLIEANTSGKFIQTIIFNSRYITFPATCESPYQTITGPTDRFLQLVRLSQY